MGSFYSTCSITGMTLRDEPTSILLLIPSTEYPNKDEHPMSYMGHRNMVVSNSGCQGLFVPFGFPIRGRYDDYGYIHSIEENEATKMLEEFFGTDIRTIVERVGDDRESVPKNNEIFQKLAVTYFRTEILEYLERDWEKIDHNVEKSRSSMGGRIRWMLDDIKDKGNSFIRFETGYIQEYTNNFYKILPVKESMVDEMKKQYYFLIRLGYHLRRSLVPSSYGSQEVNWQETYELNKLANDLLAKSMKDMIEVGYGYCDEDMTDEEKEEFFEDYPHIKEQLELINNHK